MKLFNILAGEGGGGGGARGSKALPIGIGFNSSILAISKGEYQGPIQGLPRNELGLFKLPFLQTFMVSIVGIVYKVKYAHQFSTSMRVP